MLNLTENQFDILKSAVNISKEYQCQSVDSLKRRLKDRFPGEEGDIDSALKYWGHYIESKRQVVNVISER